MNTPLPTRLLLVVFLPFATGFFLSFLFRNVNAVISKDIAGTFSLTSAELGLLTSAYFIAFATTQIPLGIFLDRYGPRLAHFNGVLQLLSQLSAQPPQPLAEKPPQD